MCLLSNLNLFPCLVSPYPFGVEGVGVEGLLREEDKVGVGVKVGARVGVGVGVGVGV